MQAFFVVKANLAVGQLVAPPYGEGHNLHCEITCRLNVDPEANSAVRARVREVLAQIDHKHLGLDMDVGVQPTLANVSQWLWEKIESALPGDVLQEMVLRQGLERAVHLRRAAR